MKNIDTSAARTNEVMTSLETKIDALIGSNLENRARRKILIIANNHLGLTSGRILLAQGRDPDQDFVDTINSAEEIGRITPEHADDLMLADIIIYARRQQSYAVFEVSLTITTDDIERARDRATAVAAISGAPAIPAVVGQTIHPPQASQAEAAGVRVIIPAMMREPESAAENLP